MIFHQVCLLELIQLYFKGKMVHPLFIYTKMKFIPSKSRSLA
jgi:hypothetical protein